MNPIDDDKKPRRKNPFDFMDDETFERIFDEVQNMFESDEFKDMLEDMFHNGIDPKNQFMQGFAVDIGPDGKPNLKKLGKRRKPMKKAMVETKQAEPMTDIIEGTKDVAVTIELPGVTKKDIDLNVTDDNLEIRVNHPELQYHKTITLPCTVKPKTTEATYKNGVLDVVVQRQQKKHDDSGFKVNIQ